MCYASENQIYGSLDNFQLNSDNCKLNCVIYSNYKLKFKKLYLSKK